MLPQIQFVLSALGAPGPLDPETGVVIFAPNLGWKDVPLKTELEERIGIPTFVDNDVNVGTLGEHTYGAGRGVQNLVGIFVGTGIGGGIILNGELFHGCKQNCRRNRTYHRPRGWSQVWVRKSWMFRSISKSYGDDKTIKKCYNKKRKKECH